MLHFDATRRQSKELDGLAYWIAERSCTLERHPDDADAGVSPAPRATGRRSWVHPIHHQHQHNRRHTP